jgi:cell division protein ZipA
MISLRWALLILGVVFIVALAWWERRRPRRPRGTLARTTARDSGSEVPPRVVREPPLTLPEVRAREPLAAHDLPVVEIASHVPVVPVLAPAPRGRDAAAAPHGTAAGAAAETDAADGRSATDSAVRAYATYLTDMAEAVAPAKSGDAAEAVDQAESGDAAEAVDPAEGDDAAEAVDPAESGHTADAVDRAAAVDAADRADAVRALGQEGEAADPHEDDARLADATAQHPLHAAADAVGTPPTLGTARERLPELPPAAPLVVDWPSGDQRRILALRLVALVPERFAGRSLRQALAAEGFLLGQFAIFHKPDEERRAVLSAASLTRPGTFDMETMDSQHFGGLSLFAVLPGPKSPPQAFDELVFTARNLNERLHGVLQDEQGCPLTPARIAQLREQLRAQAAS